MEDSPVQWELPAKPLRYLSSELEDWAEEGTQAAAVGAACVHLTQRHSPLSLPVHMSRHPHLCPVSQQQAEEAGTGPGQFPRGPVGNRRPEETCLSEVRGSPQWELVVSDTPGWESGLKPHDQREMEVDPKKSSMCKVFANHMVLGESHGAIFSAALFEKAHPFLRTPKVTPFLNSRVSSFVFFCFFF